MNLRTRSITTLALGLTLLLPAAARAQSPDLDASLEAANAAVAAEDWGAAEELYRKMQLVTGGAGTAPDVAWFGTSGLVSLYRRTGDSAAAGQVAAEVAAKRPELTGLMAVWDGDTALFAGDAATALARYHDALDPAFDRRVDDTRVGAIAWRQIARLHASQGDAVAAAAAHRALLAGYPAFVWPELEIAQAALFDAMAAGQLPLKPLASLGHDGDCTEASPCTISSGAGADGAARLLAGLGGFRFVLSAADQARLDTAIQAKAAALVSPPAEAPALVCTPALATDGFRNPMVNSGSGYVFMESIGGGAFHPGLDINGPGGCDADLGMTFYAVAKGCVTDASPTNWGSATIKHSYNSLTSTSQYGHASEISYSAGTAIGKGASLGKVGDVGTDCAHLHHELRESDHPDAANADYYSSLSLANVGDWYQNPFPFEAAHRSYINSRRADEELFVQTGGWNAVSGVGNSDDMKWGGTTSTYSRYARYYFTPASTGTYEVWAFVPWNYGTTAAARYRAARSNGVVVISTMTVNQSALYDAWTRIGQASLTAGVEYFVEVATNTGESGLQVALDDVMIHRIK